MPTARDRWAEWLLERRFGGDPELLARTLEQLGPVRDRVLDAARIGDGDVVLDVGAGDGLIGFAALDLVGADGRVIFSDISATLVERCRELAAETGREERCRFLLADATDLSPLEDASVDVVTTRSVLIYVADKRRAFGEFARVLRPGGRLSLFEPINKFNLDTRPHTEFLGYDGAEVAELVARLMVVYRPAEPAGPESPMSNFDERDLLDHALEAGFRRVRLQYEAVIEPVPPLGGPLPWATFYGTAPNPNVPTVREAVEATLSAQEAGVFESHFRPLVENGSGIRRPAVAYLSAER